MNPLHRSGHHSMSHVRDPTSSPGSPVLQQQESSDGRRKLVGASKEGRADRLAPSLSPDARAEKLDMDGDIEDEAEDDSDSEAGTGHMMDEDDDDDQDEDVQDNLNEDADDGDLNVGETGASARDDRDNHGDAVSPERDIRVPLQLGAAECPYYDLVPTTAAPQATHCHCIAITRGLKWLVTGGQDGYVRKYDFQQSVTGKIPLTVAQKHAFVDSVQRSGVLLSYWDAEDDGTHALSLLPFVN